MQKTTHQHLAYELIKLNKYNLYDGLIRNCREFYYHDIKSPLAHPKNNLVIDLSNYSALINLCDDVIEGCYNEDNAQYEEEISTVNFIKWMEQQGATDEIIKQFI